ncbi:hypothetical protein Ciccas_009636 [Cichlidogyrus casuarinus]|uniref:acetate--CoA ligase n=1 Tax=Cichlidogyrus casuarinus TaxID=1844966 RepID=A0ABD2Q0Y9_9PLAT
MKPEFYPTSTSCGYVIPGVRMIIDCSTQKLDPFKDKAIGEIYLESPFIPSIGKTIWRDDKRWIETYFSKKGYYSCFDYGSISADSLVNIYGRSDDTVKILNVRLNLHDLEAAVLEIPQVSECAFACKNKVELDDELICFLALINSSDEMAISNMVREKIRSVHPLLRHFRACAFVPALPRNRNGKVMRFILNDISRQPFGFRPTAQIAQICR